MEPITVPLNGNAIHETNENSIMYSAARVLGHTFSPEIITQ